MLRYLDLVMLNVHDKISMVINKRLKVEYINLKKRKKLRKKERPNMLNPKMVRFKKNDTSRK